MVVIVSRGGVGVRVLAFGAWGMTFLRVGVVVKLMINMRFVTLSDPAGVSPLRSRSNRGRIPLLACVAQRVHAITPPRVIISCILDSNLWEVILSQQPLLSMT